MPVIFSQQPGTVTAIAADPSVVAPLMLSLQGVNLGQNSPQISNCLVTGKTLQAKVNLQLQTAINKATFGYVFGNNPVQITVSGVLFARSCFAEDNGLYTIQEIYKKHRASNTYIPILINVGGHLYLGYLIELYIGNMDPERNMGQFALTFVGIDADIP